jgi:hypothetical protein
MPPRKRNAGAAIPLLRVESGAEIAADKKMRYAVEIFAPWMPKAEASDLIDSFLRCDPRRNWLTGKEAEIRLNLENTEREALSSRKPWDAEGISRATWYRRRETSVRDNS